jgi:Fe-S oxidoreductase
MNDPGNKREGSLEAPVRHPVDWQSEAFYDEQSLMTELERVFDICHGCRRCFNLCHSFPTLFDAIDESESMELDTVAKEVVPPHEWNVDFPHLMLRAKAYRFKKQGARKRDRMLTSTDTIGKLAGIPVVVQAVNATNRSKLGRKALQKTLGVHADAPVPPYHSNTARKRLDVLRYEKGERAKKGSSTRGKVVLFTTCYGNYNMPALAEDLVAVFEHNDIPVAITGKESCCGMPKLELGDLEAVSRARDANIPELAYWVDMGFDIVTPIPSCTLMFKQELPLMFPRDAEVLKVGSAMFDPFEYLMLRHKDGLLKTDFKDALGKIAYQVPCHLRVQNIGLKTRDLLELVPDTEVEAIERCSGHDISKKIARPVVGKVKKAGADHFISDCPMAAEQIAQGLDNHGAGHPMALLRRAYGI